MLPAKTLRPAACHDTLDSMYEYSTAAGMRLRMRTVELEAGGHGPRVATHPADSQPPDEMYFGRGATVPEQLALGRAAARRARMEANRARRCATCA